MRTAAFIVVATLFMSAACTPLPPAGNGSANGNSSTNDNGSAGVQPGDVVDASGFAVFTYVRDSAAGICPSIGLVSRAVIERIADDSYIVSLSVLDIGVPGETGCIVGADPTVCYVETPYDPRLLFFAETADMITLFSMLETAGPISSCAAEPVVPCAISHFTWDDILSSSDNPCGELRVGDQAIEGFVGGLRQRSDTLAPFVEDFSGFSTFHLAAETALVGCSADGSLESVEITDDGTGGYAFLASVIDEVDAGAADCDGRFVEGRCFVTTAIERRVLTPGEAETVRMAFSEVRLSGEPGPECERMPVDPCSVTTYTWNDVSFTDRACSTNHVVGNFDALWMELTGTGAR